jgi:hypothetical protein
VDLLAESHNALDFLFLEIADAIQRRCALLEMRRNPSLTVIVTDIKEVSLQCERINQVTSSSVIY